MLNYWRCDQSPWQHVNNDARAWECVLWWYNLDGIIFVWEFTIFIIYFCFNWNVTQKGTKLLKSPPAPLLTDSIQWKITHGWMILIEKSKCACLMLNHKSRATLTKPFLYITIIYLRLDSQFHVGIECTKQAQTGRNRHKQECSFGSHFLCAEFGQKQKRFSIRNFWPKFLGLIRGDLLLCRFRFAYP